MGVKSVPPSRGSCDGIWEVLARGWHRQAPKAGLSPFEDEVFEDRILVFSAIDCT